MIDAPFFYSIVDFFTTMVGRRNKRKLFSALKVDSCVVDKPNTLLIVRNFYHFMPVITVAIFSGRSQREKDRFAEAITEDAVKILGVKREDLIIIFKEEPHGNWYASGVRL